MSDKVKKKCPHCRHFIQITPIKTAQNISCPKCSGKIPASPSSSKKKNGVSFSKKLLGFFS